MKKLGTLLLILLSIACSKEDLILNVNTPSNLESTVYTNSQISLNWKDNSDNEDGFNIYRKLKSQDEFLKIGAVEVNITEFEDTSVIADNEYVYVINAFNAEKTSSLSTESHINIVYDIFENLPEWTNIPDPGFEQGLIDYDLDDVLDGKVLTSKISGITGWELTGDHLKWLGKLFEHRNIYNTTGIENFVSIQFLSFWGNDFTTIDVSNLRKLQTLGLSECPLETVDLSKNTELLEIDFQHNSERIDDPSYPYGKTQGFTEIDLRNNVKMERIYLWGNRISELDVSMCPNLTDLWIGARTMKGFNRSEYTMNPIKYIDLSKNPKMNVLVANNCDLEYLNIKGTANDGVPRTCTTSGNPNLFEIIVDNVDRIEQYRKTDPNGYGTYVWEVWYLKDEHTNYVE